MSPESLNLPTLISIVVGAVAAIWYFVTKYYIPQKLKQEREKDEFHREINKDTLDHQQKIEIDTLQRSLDVLDSLVQHLISRDNGRSERINSQLEKLSRSYIRLEDMMTIVVKDWSAIRDEQKNRDERLEEVLSDIDIWLSELSEWLRENDKKKKANNGQNI